YSVYPSPGAGHLFEFKQILGYRILDALDAVVEEDEIKFGFGSIIVETPRKNDLGWTEDLKNYTRKSGSGEDHVLLPVRFSKLNDRIGIWSAPLELFCEI